MQEGKKEMHSLKGFNLVSGKLAKTKISAIRVFRRALDFPILAHCEELDEFCFGLVP
jgi:hypothetical protein